MVRRNLETFLEEGRYQGESGYPAFVEREFRRYLDCGQLGRGFARVRCPACGFERLVAFSWHGARPTSRRTSSTMFSLRFASRPATAFVVGANARRRHGRRRRRLRPVAGHPRAFRRRTPFPSIPALGALLEPATRTPRLDDNLASESVPTICRAGPSCVPETGSERFHGTSSSFTGDLQARTIPGILWSVRGFPADVSYKQSVFFGR